MGQGCVHWRIKLSYTFKTILVFNWNYFDNLQLEIFSQAKEKAVLHLQKYLKSFYQEDTVCLQDAMFQQMLMTLFKHKYFGCYDCSIDLADTFTHGLVDWSMI